MTFENTFSLFCVETHRWQKALLLPQCHYSHYNKQSLLPQAKCNISELKIPNQYFHYPHYKISINGSSVGKAPSLSPFTSECCSGLTAGIAGCAAFWRVFPLEITGEPALLLQGFRKKEGKKIRHTQSSFPLSCRHSRKVRNRSWILICFASFEQEWSWWEGFSLKGESASRPHSPHRFRQDGFKSVASKKQNTELEIHRVVTTARLKYQRIFNSADFTESFLRSLRCPLIPPEK